MPVSTVNWQRIHDDASGKHAGWQVQSSPTTTDQSIARRQTGGPR
jgi:hypothetical protein